MVESRGALQQFPTSSVLLHFRRIGKEREIVGPIRFLAVKASRITPISGRIAYGSSRREGICCSALVTIEQFQIVTRVTHSSAQQYGV